MGVIDGEEYFWVKWDEALMPRSALKNAEELIVEFKARCRTVTENKGRDGDMPAMPLTRLKDPYSGISIPASRPQTKVKWTQEDDTRLVDTKNRGCLWKEIYTAFPDRSPGKIHVRCSTKLKSRLANGTS